MKAFRFLRRWSIGLLCLALPATVLAQARPTLKIQVTGPAGWDAAQASRCAELFGDSLRGTLARQGLDLPIVPLRSVDDPARTPYLLRVNLTDWRIANGNIDCSFTATLHTPAGEHSIGVFKNTLWAPGIITAEFGQPYYLLSPQSIRSLSAQLATQLAPASANRPAST